MAERLNFVVMIIGGRGTGKTTYVKGYIPNYNKVLICDTLLHPAYSDIPVITVDMIPRWKAGVKRILVDDETICDVFTALSSHFYNGAVICEDAGKYVEARLQKPIKKFLIDTKQQNNDVFILNHFWSDISPKALKLADRLTLFKTIDTPLSRKTELASYELIQRTWDRVQAMPNKWDKLSIPIS